MHQPGCTCFCADEDLFELGGNWYNVKARPGLQIFLEEAAKLFELEVYTFGTRAYADAVVRFLDPSGALFSDRVITR